MTERKDQDRRQGSDTEVKASLKKAYRAPELIEWGTIQELTGGGSGNGDDSPGSTGTGGT
jgi:hypothetical protein